MVKLGKFDLKKDLLITYAIIFLILAIILGINPAHRMAWAIDLGVTVFVIMILLLTYNRFKFSATSYTLMFIFGIIPLIGTHFGFANVPLGPLNGWLGDASRNYYDRIAHFAAGLIFALPLRELFVKTSKLKNYWSYIIPVVIILAAGAFYEVIEWWFVVLFPGEFETVFLASQGDVWDAQKDLLLDGFGALMTMIAAFIVNRTKYLKDGIIR